MRLASSTRIRKEGTVTLTNFKDASVDLLASVSFGGTADSASDDGEITIDDLHTSDWENGSIPLNNHSVVRWQIRLEPGQTKTLTGSCVYYVP